jgi:hypothetical protein
MKANQSREKLSRVMLATTLAAGLSLSLPAGAAAQEATGAEAQVGSVVTGAKRSQHFDAVSKHLDLGGAIYGYMDVDGDVEKLAGMAQSFLDFAKEGDSDNMPPHLKRLSIAKVFEELGLDGIEAIGLSSIKMGDIYHNKAYAHVPAGRKGLLKVLGGDSKPFVAKQLAPAGSDLIIEQSLNIRAGWDVVSAMVLRFGGPDASEEFQASVGEVIPQLGVSVAEILGRLDTRLTLIGRIHPDKPLEIPDAPMEIPSFDMLIVLDDVGWLYEKVTGGMKAEMPAEQVAEMFVKGDGFESIALPPMPSPDMVVVQPVIRHDIANKRLMIASTQAFLDECLSGKASITGDADFKTAMRGLPAEGNGLSYVSAEFIKEYRNMIDGMMKQSPMGGAEKAIGKLLDHMLPVSSGLSQASVMVNTPEGILSVANTSSSHKDAVVMGGVGLLAGFGSAFAVQSKTMIDERFLIENEAAFPDEAAFPVPPAPAVEPDGTR